LSKNSTQEFPQCFSDFPWLMQGKKSAVRMRILSWLDKHNISPHLVAEIDDSALMKSFGEAGFVVFSSPTLIEKYVADKYVVKIIGNAEEIKELYYIISPERRLKHPAIIEIVNAANN